MTARKALLVASFDSQLKWAASLAPALQKLGFDCRFVVPDDRRHSFSAGQLADFAGDGIELEYLPWDQVVRESLTVDAVALVVQGSFVSTFVHELYDLARERGVTPPVTIAGWVGVVIHEINAGFLDRFATDVVAVNSRSDLRTFQGLCAGLGLPTDSLVLSGLPLLTEYRAAPVDGPITTVLYADQPTMPSSRRDRLFVYEQLIAYARQHPDRTVVLKPRHRLEEGTIHKMKYHPELVLSGVARPDNFVIDYTPISERLTSIDLMLVLSSTAALEAVGAGVRTAFVTDLGVREPLGNHIFVGSGLLRTFDQIAADDIGVPEPAWIDDYFLKHAEDEADPSHRAEHPTPAQKLAERVVELLETDGPRPSALAAETSYFQSQHRLLAHRRSTQESGDRTGSKGSTPGSSTGAARRLRLLAQALLPSGAVPVLRRGVRTIKRRIGRLTQA